MYFCPWYGSFINDGTTNTPALLNTVYNSQYVLTLDELPLVIGTPKGDVNTDGKVTIVDALLIARYTAGLNPSPFNVSEADVNCDGIVNINDALQVARYSSGLIISLCIPDENEVITLANK